MKIFIYKLSLVAIVIVIVFKLTIGSIISSVEKKITNLKSKNERIEIISKIREEIINANKKDRILTKEDSDIISTFLNKINNELNQR
jgi:K+-sensing histidine kinase KdpD